jgi:hypothetical protein
MGMVPRWWRNRSKEPAAEPATAALPQAQPVVPLNSNYGDAGIHGV